jgi:hypothetical protein
VLLASANSEFHPIVLDGPSSLTIHGVVVGRRGTLSRRCGVKGAILETGTFFHRGQPRSDIEAFAAHSVEHFALDALLELAGGFTT